MQQTKGGTLRYLRDFNISPTQAIESNPMKAKKQVAAPSIAFENP